MKVDTAFNILREAITFEFPSTISFSEGKHGVDAILKFRIL